MSDRGMRNILKHKPDVLRLMELKLAAGLYDGEYPRSYEILSLNPPVAEPPGTKSVLQAQKILKRKLLRKGKRLKPEERFELVLPTDKYVKSYLARNPERLSEMSPRWEDVVGIGDVDSHYGFHKGRVTDAYHFAMKQVDYVQRHHDRVNPETGKPMSLEELEAESVREVEETLKQEDRAERFYARKMAKRVAREMEEKKKNRGRDGGVADASSSSIAVEEKEDGVTNEEEYMDRPPPKKELPGVASVLSSDAALSMSQWGDQLSQVPYNRWTVGAATALDHWIATDVLGLSERSWRVEVLERRDRGRLNDIDTVRGALFPETLPGAGNAADDVDEEGIMFGGYTNKDDVYDDDDDDVPITALKETERSIDELLASLGGAVDDGEDDAAWNKTEDELPWFETDEEKNQRLLAELKSWQAKNFDTPYDDWTEKERSEFNEWLVGYVASVRADDQDGSEHRRVDLKETREAILSEPYFTDEENESMWSKISSDDITEVELVLQDILDNSETYLESLQRGDVGGGGGGDEKQRQMEKEGLLSFLELPYEEQVFKLRSIGALRSLHDDSSYPTKSENLDVLLKDNLDTVRDGVEVDGVVVPDLKGNLTAKELFDVMSDDDHRFSFVKTTFGAGGEVDEEMKGEKLKQYQRDRVLYRAWRRYRANVATHEEGRFLQRKLPLERVKDKTKKD